MLIFSKRLLFSLSFSPNIHFTVKKSQKPLSESMICGQHQHTYLKGNVNSAFKELSLSAKTSQVCYTDPGSFNAALPLHSHIST